MPDGNLSRSRGAAAGTRGRTSVEARLQRALAQLRDVEKRHADTIELAAIGIAHVDDSGRYVHVNRWMCELLGYTREELLGMTVKQISHPDDKNVADDGAGAVALRRDRVVLRREALPAQGRLDRVGAA